MVVNDGEPSASEGEARSCERTKTFTDAVVAIAMTLLILPLLDTVSDIAEEQLSTWDYIEQDQGRLVSFFVSFIVIASSWVSHDRLYAPVVKLRGALTVLNFAWMCTIILLPVATALAGAVRTDNSKVVAYVGMMWVSSALMTAMHAVVRRSPRLVTADCRSPQDGLWGSLSVTLLFTAALTVGLLIPGPKLLPLAFLLLAKPAGRLLSSVMGRRRAQPV